MRITMRIILKSFILGFLIGITTLANAADFSLKSSAFADGSTIPTLYTCNGENIPPPLSWANAPPQTKSFALILSSPDAPTGQLYLWVLYNIPSNATTLEEGSDTLPDGTMVGMNSLFETEYRGPCPPDARLHRYFFTLYALDRELNLTSGEDLEVVLSKIKRHILKTAQLSCVFSH